MHFPKNRITLGSWLLGIVTCAVLAYWLGDALDAGIPVKLVLALITVAISLWLMSINYALD